MLIGNLGSHRRARVGPGGEVTLASGLTIEWWIGADDRWHVPRREITCRQNLVGAAPVARTAVRVPGGDAVAFTFAARQGRGEYTVIEIENQSPLPFAAAIVLRNVPPELAARLGDDGAPVIVTPRVSPLVATVEHGGDLLEVLRSGGATSALPSSTLGLDMAFLFPVAHRASTKVAVVMDDAPTIASPVLGALPTVDEIVRAWDAQVARAARISDVDAIAHGDYGAALRALLLRADFGDAPLSNSVRSDTSEAATAGHDESEPTIEERCAIVIGLLRVGLREGLALAADLTKEQSWRGGFGSVEATALAAHALLLAGQHVDDMRSAAAGALEYLTRALRKRSLDDDSLAYGAVLGLGAALFDYWDEPRAATSARDSWTALGSPWPMPHVALPPLPALASGASLVADDPARLLHALNDGLDRVVTWMPDGSVDVLSGFTDAWRGAPIEARDVPVPRGRLSIALRWHGTRAALLWDAPEGQRVTCRALSTSWSAIGGAGEAFVE